MNRLIFLPCFFLLGILRSEAQGLQYIPPLIPKDKGADTSVAFVFNTMDVRRVDEEHIRIGGEPYANTVQITDARQPWPPRWYTNMPVYTNEMYNKDIARGTMRFDFMLDVKAEAGYFSFFKSLFTYVWESDNIKETKPFNGYILLDEQMKAVDTVLSVTPNINLYWHDFRINSKGERLISVKVNELLDISKRTGNPIDTAVKSSVDIIQVVDDDNQVIFSWKATDGLPTEIFQYEESLKAVSFARNNGNVDFVDWSHLTSVIWDHDGNILYALRFIGIGKISRKDGSVIWKIDYDDLPIVSGKDTIDWYFPHDLNALYETDSSNVYSLYSLGKMHHGIRSAGVIFEVNKKTNKVSLVKYIYPHKNFSAEGQGSFDYFRNGDYIFSYGVYWDSEHADRTTLKDAIEFGKGNGEYYIYRMPTRVHAYKAHVLRDWPLPPRPGITKQGDVLTAVGDFANLTWYRLSGPNLAEAVEVAKGKSIKPVKGAVYCVEGDFGIGRSVSLPFKN